MRIEVHPSAQEEFREAVRHYTGAGYGRKFVGEFLNVADFIRHYPLAYEERSHETRRANLRRFPYHVSYVIRGDVVWILAVAHAARKPFYWKKRAKDV